MAGRKRDRGECVRHPDHGVGRIGRIVLAALCLAVPGTGAPVRAHEPASEPARQYYGPLRICDENFAFDVSAGEGFVREGGYGSFPDLILSTGGYLTIGGRWTGDSGPSARYVHARGEIELQGQTLRRFEVKPPDGGTEFAYTAPGFAGSERFTIRSNRFDGSDRDRAILDRIVLGDRARQMCASVPLELRPLPERDQPEVRWLAPARHRGPLTICRAGLAFDVASDEEAMLGWGKDHLPVRIVAFARSTDIAGFDERLWRRSGEKDARGSLSRDPRFVTETPLVLLSGQVSPSGRFGIAYAALRRRADPAPSSKEGIPALFFTFDRETTDAERQAFIARVRTQHPSDRCFAPRPS